MTDLTGKRVRFSYRHDFGTDVLTGIVEPTPWCPTTVRLDEKWQKIALTIDVPLRDLEIAE